MPDSELPVHVVVASSLGLRIAGLAGTDPAPFLDQTVSNERSYIALFVDAVTGDQIGGESLGDHDAAELAVTKLRRIEGATPDLTATPELSATPTFSKWMHRTPRPIPTSTRLPSRASTTSEPREWRRYRYVERLLGIYWSTAEINMDEGLVSIAGRERIQPQALVLWRHRPPPQNQGQPMDLSHLSMPLMLDLVSCGLSPDWLLEAAINSSITDRQEAARLGITHPAESYISCRFHQSIRVSAGSFNDCSVRKETLSASGSEWAWVCPGPGIVYRYRATRLGIAVLELVDWWGRSEP
jgi:hypothetical protein